MKINDTSMDHTVAFQWRFNIRNPPQKEQKISKRKQLFYFPFRHNRRFFDIKSLSDQRSIEETFKPKFCINSSNFKVFFWRRAGFISNFKENTYLFKCSSLSPFRYVRYRLLHVRNSITVQRVLLVSDWSTNDYGQHPNTSIHWYRHTNTHTRMHTIVLILNPIFSRHHNNNNTHNNITLNIFLFLRCRTNS